LHPGFLTGTARVGMGALAREICMMEDGRPRPSKARDTAWELCVGADALVRPHCSCGDGRSSPVQAVKRHLVCKPWTIEKADENSNGIP
jgi:hypothetical protein